MIARMIAIWNRLDKSMKLAVACMALYILLYAVVDISMEIGRLIALCLM